MTARIQNRLHVIGRQIKTIISLRLSGAIEQDQQTWARVVKSYEDLPECYQDFLRSQLSTEDTFPYTVLTSTYEKFDVLITGKLICVIDQVVFVLEESAGKLIETCYPMDDINYVEVSSKLLEFRVTINGVTNTGIQTSSVFRCSTVTDYIFAPIVKRIRLRNVSPSGSAQHQGAAMFDHWSDRNYKFMNLARHCMLPGETMLIAVLQPEIHNGLFSFPAKSFHSIKSPTHACILTEKEWIMLREDLLQRRKDKYGSTCTFVPLDKILSISMSAKAGNLLAVSILLTDQECFECLFDASFEAEVQKLVAQTRERMHQQPARVHDESRYTSL